MATITYTVRQGDTLSALARRYGTTVQTLVEANGIRNPNLIQTGMRLAIPSSSSSSSSRPAAPSSRTTTSSPTRLPATRGTSTSLPRASTPTRSTSTSSSSRPPSGFGYGSSGPGITTLQHYLKNRGYSPGSIDGQWGPKTQAAYAAYVKDKGGVPWDVIRAKMPVTTSRGAPAATPRPTTPGMTPARSSGGTPRLPMPAHNREYISGTGPAHRYYPAFKNAESDNPAFKGWADNPKLYTLLQHESYGGNPIAKNPSSTAYGMFQFLDATWDDVGGQRTSDPYKQAVYGFRYIKQRYGSLENAWNFWSKNGWY